MGDASVRRKIMILFFIFSLSSIKSSAEDVSSDLNEFLAKRVRIQKEYYDLKGRTIKVENDPTGRKWEKRVAGKGNKLAELGAWLSKVRTFKFELPINGENKDRNLTTIGRLGQKSIEPISCTAQTCYFEVSEESANEIFQKGYLLSSPDKSISNLGQRIVKYNLEEELCKANDNSKTYQSINECQTAEAIRQAKRYSSRNCVIFQDKDPLVDVIKVANEKFEILSKGVSVDKFCYIVPNKISFTCSCETKKVHTKLQDPSEAPSIKTQVK